MAGFAWAALAAGGVQAQEADADAGPPGTSGQLIEEPVFMGEAYVYQAGVGNPRSIVLIHGIGDDGARDFSEIIPWLARDFHVLTFDLPGFGRSSKANVLYSPANYAAFVKYVADKYARRPFILLGHSMGGVAALRYTASYPADVERLVVVDAPGVLHRLSFTSQFLAHLGMDFLPPALNLQEKFTNLVRKLIWRAERSPLDPEAVLASAQLRQTVLGADPAKIAGLALVVENLSKALPRIGADTLIIWGRDDRQAPLRTGRLLARTIPRARLVVLDKTGHVPMLESPQPFRAALAPFLRREAPPPAKPEGDRIAAGKHGDVLCERKRKAVFEGEYATLIIKSCDGALIRNARVRALRIYSSTVTIEDSEIGGGEIGLHAHSATVVMTGGAISGKVAINVLGSRLDLAGVRVTATEAAVRAQRTSSVVFSVSRIESPRTRGVVHGYYAVTPRTPL